MIALYFGLTAANLLLLSIVFGLGLFAIGPDQHPTGMYVFHISMAIAAGLLTTLTHIGIFMYFMSTTKWLEAATNKFGEPAATWFIPAGKHKSKVFAIALFAIVFTMLTMFAGAGADPTVNPWWPAEVHLIMAVGALSVNAFCALLEYKYIGVQSKLMSDALDKLNNTQPASLSKEDANA